MSQSMIGAIILVIFISDLRVRLVFPGNIILLLTKKLVVTYLFVRSTGD